jgi:hypothetical protein
MSQLVRKFVSSLLQRPKETKWPKFCHNILCSLADIEMTCQDRWVTLAKKFAFEISFQIIKKIILSG